LTGRWITLDATLVIAILIVAAAGAISGLAGFGFGLVSVPPLLLIFDPPTVVILVKVLALATSWLILLDSWREIRWRTLAEILPTALLGQILGIILLRDLDTAALKLLASAVVVGFALLVLRGITITGTNRRAAGLAAGGVSGILSTSTGLSGPPIVFLFTLRHYPVTAFRATTVTYFVIIDLVSLPALFAQGIVDRDTVWAVLILSPSAFIGRFAGARLTRFVSPPQFRRVTLALLLVTGLIGIASAIQGLV
jgi:uncharacterized membrane protein YfcA